MNQYLKLLFNALIICLLAAITLTGCSRQLKIGEMSSDDAFIYLKNLYYEGKYQQATEGLEYFTLHFSGSVKSDSAQYLLGESHYNLKQYLLAADAFEELTRRFPTSPLVAEAMFMTGKCYFKLSPSYHLEQTYTEQAIDALQTFIDYYPQYTQIVSEAQDLIFECRSKLAQKVYSIGALYLKSKEYTAAAIYLQTVIDKYYDTKFAPLAIYQMGRTRLKQDQYELARDLFTTFLAKYPDHSLRLKVEKEIQELDKNNP